MAPLWWRYTFRNFWCAFICRYDATNGCKNYTKLVIGAPYIRYFSNWTSKSDFTWKNKWKWPFKRVSRPIKTLENSKRNKKMPLLLDNKDRKMTKIYMLSVYIRFGFEICRALVGFDSGMCRPTPRNSVFCRTWFGLESALNRCQVGRHMSDA